MDDKQQQPTIHKMFTVIVIVVVGILWITVKVNLSTASAKA